MAVKQFVISVIIPTYNRPEQLKQCLDALTKQTYAHDQFEVIVVDDGGAVPLDGLVRSYPERLNIALTRQENAGPAAARNRGASIAIGTVLAFTDDDCFPEPAWLEAFAEAYHHAPSALLGGSVVNRDAENSYAVTSQLILDGAYSFYNRNPENARFFASSNIALPAELFHAVGGFSETFRIASEDREFCDRWHWKGYRLRFISEACVHHARELNLGGFIQQHFNYGRGAYQYHHERARRRSGSLAREVKLFDRFVWTLTAPVRRRSLGQAARIFCLLGLWQMANTVGFLYAAVRKPGR